MPCATIPIPYQENDLLHNLLVDIALQLGVCVERGFVAFYPWDDWSTRDLVVQGEASRATMIASTIS